MRYFTLKNEFLNFVETLMKENPDKTNELMTDNIMAYLNILKEVKDYIDKGINIVNNDLKEFKDEVRD